MRMNSLRGLTAAIFLLAASSTMKAVVIDYNFTAQLTNNSGALFLVDGSFNADPTLANTSHGADGIGETYSVAPVSIAASLTDVNGTFLSPAPATIVYTGTDLQNAGLVYFSSYNPASATGDPIWTLSQSIGMGEYLTLVLDGSSSNVYESTTLGGTTNLLASDGAVVASAANLPTPEPATFGMLAIAGFGLLGVRKFASKR